MESSHAVDASKHSAATLVAMRVEFLLGEDIATALHTELLEPV